MCHMTLLGHLKTIQYLTRKNTPSNAMDAAEQEAARAKELTWLNASAKGFQSQFVSTRNLLVQALPLYADGATASRRRTIDDAISNIGLQADKVHDTYQRLIEFDKDENHQANYEQRQNRKNTEHNDTYARTRTRCSEK
jgi:hypothetical protein